MMKLLLLLIVVVLAGCGESQLDRRARVEGPGKEAASEEVKANEEAVTTPKEAPKAPQAKGRPGDGKGQARPPQQGRRPGGGFGRRDPYANLGLNEEQQAKIKAIQEEQRAEMRKLFEELRGGGGDRQAMGEKMTALRDKYQKQSDAILNDEQKKKLAEERAQRPQGGQGGRGQGGRGQGGRGQGGRGQDRGNEFAALGVNETQQKSLDAARQGLSTQMRELFLDRNTPREEREPKIQKIREDYEAKIKGILTEEQFKKFKEGPSSQRGQGSRPGQGGTRPGGSRLPNRQ